MKGTTLLRTASIVTAGAICIAFGTAEAGHAANIDTTPSWDGSSFTQPFGEPDTATYGQTFTVGTDNVLQSFSFWLGGFQDGSVDFAAYVMGWNGTNATGPILYQSAQQTKSSNSSFQEFAFNTGGINLNPGQQYVAFLSASNFFDGNPGTTGMGTIIPDGDVYDGGGFVFYNNGSNFNLLTSDSWDSFSDRNDAAFKASFTPIPTPALLPGLLGMGVAAWRKRKAEAQTEVQEEA